MKSLKSKRLVNEKVFFMMVVMVVSCFAQASAFNATLQDSIQAVYPYIQYGVSAIMFFFFVAKAIPAITGNNKEANWWELLGIIAVIALLNVLPALYNAIAGTSFTGGTP